MIVFGGYVDTSAQMKFYDDVHMFSFEAAAWTKLNIAKGDGPKPRSAAHLAVSEDTLILFGGYAKEKSYGDFRGVTVNDMWTLALGTETPKWAKLKPAGEVPPPRSGTSSVFDGSRLVICGGAVDEDLVDDLQTRFYNDIFVYVFAKNLWFHFELGKDSGRTLTDSRRF